MRTATAIYLALRAARQAEATTTETIELVALCVLARCHYGRPSFNLTLGQARALIGRCYARNA